LRARLANANAIITKATNRGPPADIDQAVGLCGGGVSLGAMF
jgi:hypothetical protein